MSKDTTRFSLGYTLHRHWRRWRRYRRRSSSVRRLLLESVLNLLFFKFCVSHIPLRYLVRLRRIRVCPIGVSPPEIASAVKTASRFLRLQNSCLVEALALFTMLRRRGHDPSLHIGARFVESGKMGAHAWLSLEDETLLGGDPGDFHMVGAFGGRSPSLVH